MLVVIILLTFIPEIFFKPLRREGKEKIKNLKKVKENKIMTKKKLMMAGLSAGLVAVVGIGGTLAYLSDKSEVVTNTFTVGTGYIPGEDENRQ